MEVGISRIRRGATLPLACAALSLLSIESHAQDKPDPNGWKELAVVPGTAIQHLSFVSGTVGYAASGVGQIFKTTDGGLNWLPVLDLSWPYYWYGVQALNANDVVVSGFFDSNWGVQEALIRWSHDGGASWSDDLVVSDADWADQVYFWDSITGFATAISLHGQPNYEFRTTVGGLQLTDWTAAAIDPHGGWFGEQFSALPNGHVRISGITYCESLDYAATWNCRPSIDNVFDGATFFVDDKNGWVGGGGSTGDPPITNGWVHRTTDGGDSWSGRTLDGPWQIDSIISSTRKTAGRWVAPATPEAPT
jgi:hypothetical protein